MTKEDLISGVQETLQGTACQNFGKDDIKTVIEAALISIKAAVAMNDTVTLRGFGTFQNKARKAKKARNIKAGTTIDVPAHNVVYFKPSKEFTAYKG